jgi:Tol biopolymer transport system component
MPGSHRGLAAPFVLFALFLIAGAGSVKAQEEFGKNKVQYGDKDWYVVSTRHFDIHFTENAGAIGEYAARHLEAMYDTVSRIMGFPLKNKVPVILYSTPAEFQQTNIIPYLLPEGVGGFTEIFKNRVVLPFEGSYTEFHHVLQHELVHAFMFDRQNSLGNKFASTQQAIPLWFGEGLAEYSSLGWNLGSEFYMMDAVLFGYVGNPAENGLPGFLAYKGGQLFYYYLAQTFGPGFIRDWVGQVARGKDVAAAFKDLAKVSMRETGQIWLREIKAIYWPELKDRRYGKSVARQLTDHTQDLSNINMQPAISPDGKRIAYFSDLNPMVGVYIMDVEKEKVVRSIAQAGQERGHLSFYPFQSRISWSPDSRRIAFVSKTGDRDVITLADADGRRTTVIGPPGIQGIQSPAFSPDGKTLVFSGLKDGFSDLFLWHLERKELKRLTHDIALDQNPAFAPSGKWIAFESDRTRPDLPQRPRDPFASLPDLGAFKDIYRIGVEGGTPELILGGPYDEKTPAFGPSDSLIVFVSNRSGIDNMYLARHGGGPWPDTASSAAGDTAAGSGEGPAWRAAPISNLTSTVFTPSWSKDGSRLAFTLFENRGWDIFLMRNPRERVIREPLPKTRFVRKMEDTAMRFFSPLNLENLTSFVRESKPGNKVADKGRKGSRVAGAGEDAPDVSEPAAADTAGPRLAGEAPPADTAGAGGDGRLAEGADAGTGMPDADVEGGGSGPGDTALASAAGLDTAGRSPEHAHPPSSLPPEAPGRAFQEVVPPPEPEPPAPVDSSRVAGALVTEETDYLTHVGEFKVKPYKPKWGLELAAADIGYNTFSRGVSGQTYLTVSDLLGNHKISFALASGGTSFRSINGLVNYDLLKYRTDYSFMAFNFTNYLPDGPGLYFFDRQFGANASIRYPLSIFTRFQLDLAGYSLSRSLYDAIYGMTVPDSIYPNEELQVVRPSVSWVNDNAEYGITGPVIGRRMRLTTSLVPPLFDDSVSFYQVDGDFRRYWMFWKKYALAFRVTAGFSQPIGGYGNPQVYLGGGDDLIPFVARTKPGNGPENLAEVAFSQLAVPLRGFRYYEFRGDRKFITNIEFRYPFIETLRIAWPLPITLHYLMGVAFVDYGGAWSGVAGESELETAFDTMGLGYGYGFRLNLGIFVLRYTRAHTLEGVGIGEDEFRSYWSLGADF